jgi:hypothetical protein
MRPGELKAPETEPELEEPATGEDGDQPPEDDYDVDAWKKYYAKHPEAKRSVGAAGENDPKVTGGGDGTETEETEPEEDELDEGEGDDDSDPARKLEKQLKIEDELSPKAERLDRKPRKEKISDSFNKKELEDSGWLKKREPDKVRRRRFMDWLEKNHNSGEPHEHLNPGSPEAERALQDWRDEEGGDPESQ